MGACSSNNRSNGYAQSPASYAERVTSFSKPGSLIPTKLNYSPPGMCYWAQSTPAQILSMRGDQGSSRVMADFGTAYDRDITAFMSKEDNGPDKQVFYAQDSREEIEEMTFWRKGNSRLYYYSGLEKSAAAARREEGIDDSTAICVLMLDEYAIQNKTGDPSNPLTFWPYTAFYAIPLGISFSICKEVGAAQGRGDTAQYTKMICEALDALAQTAGQKGFENVYITADCGYYALAFQAYVEQLQQLHWELLPGTPAFQVRSFRVPVNHGRFATTVHLALGSTQMIADPTCSIAQRLENAAVIYATADLNGWYTGNSNTSKTIAKELEEAYASNYFETSEGSLWWRANEGLFWGITLASKEQWAASIWNDVALKLIELQNPFAYLIGMYIGYRTWQAAGDSQSKSLVKAPQMNEAMTLASMVAEEVLHELMSNQQPLLDWLEGGLQYLDILDCSHTDRDGLASDPKPCRRSVSEVMEGVSSLSVFKAILAIVGGVADHEGERKFVKDGILEATKKLLKKPAFKEGLEDGQKFHYPMGFRYVEWYSRFVYHVNTTILGKNQGEGNFFDAQKLFLLDLRYVPGFGSNVARGDTVWSYAQSYFWINAIFGRFAEVVQETMPQVGLAYHLECTELLTFLEMLQEQEMAVVGNVNYLFMASMGNNAPLKFVRYSKLVAPASLMCLYQQDELPEVRYFRRRKVPMRTPALDAAMYLEYRDIMYPPGALTTSSLNWSKVAKAGGMFGRMVLAKRPQATCQFPGSMWVCSTQLPVKYFPDAGYIQYAGQDPFAS